AWVWVLSTEVSMRVIPIGGFLAVRGAATRNSVIRRDSTGGLGAQARENKAVKPFSDKSLKIPLGNRP
ncbi:MAG TPA: hypothetical protein VEH77_04335, partial [Roseiarcus sp.]|nr:hypothetical protein [Roseiarcus sp.]